MISISTIEQHNFDVYLSQLYPDLSLIKSLLHETGVNPLVLPKIIRSLANLSYGTGYGKVEIFMSKYVVTAVNGEERDKVDQPIVAPQKK